MGGSRPRHQTAQSLIEQRLTPPVLIFGLGFTGRRLARRLLARGSDVFAAVRAPGRFDDLARLGLTLRSFDADFPPNGIVFHSIPALAPAENSQIRRRIEACAPRRIVYISSTGVYGHAQEADARTPASPADERGVARLAEEEWIATGLWSHIILRAAAIYGPGRGVHVAIREGRIPRGAGMVSRIHVDDLAAIAETALFSALGGRWPVADGHPCPSAEIAAVFGGQRSENPPKPAITISGRKVDGSAILEALGIELAYPDWQSGILASIAEEKGGIAPELRPAPG